MRSYGGRSVIDLEHAWVEIYGRAFHHALTRAVAFNLKENIGVALVTDRRESAKSLPKRNCRRGMTGTQSKPLSRADADEGQGLPA